MGFQTIQTVQVMDAHKKHDIQSDGIPRHLRLLMVGDSLTRYQYLSLAYYLRHGEWESAHTTAEHPRRIINEGEYDSWEAFFGETNQWLAPYEWCDCYRTNTTSVFDIVEARYYHDPRYDNYVYFIPKFGPATIQGTWEPESLSLAVAAHDGDGIEHVDEESRPYNQSEHVRNASHPVPPTWQYTWSNLGELISRLQNKGNTNTFEPPTHVVLNGGIWPSDEEIRNPDDQDEMIRSLRSTNVTIIYKTTTALRNDTAGWDYKVAGPDVIAQAHNESQLPLLEQYEERLCSMVDHCLDLRWTSKVPPQYYWDALHFYEPVYRWMNYDLLVLLTQGVNYVPLPPPPMESTSRRRTH
jgi:hypothetical protein